ncbi:hypothetical protein NPIL_533501, partial [Nephila pilipes]
RKLTCFEIQLTRIQDLM